MAFSAHRPWRWSRGRGRRPEPFSTRRPSAGAAIPHRPQLLQHAFHLLLIAPPSQQKLFSIYHSHINAIFRISMPARAAMCWYKRTATWIRCKTFDSSKEKMQLEIEKCPSGGRTNHNIGKKWKMWFDFFPQNCIPAWGLIVKNMCPAKIEKNYREFPNSNLIIESGLKKLIFFQWKNLKGFN